MNNSDASAMESLGIYVHVPFCRRKCDYCSFYSLPAAGPDDPRLTAYTESLIRDVNSRAPELNRYTADTVYVGGGTPSIMPAPAFASLLDTFRSRYRLASEGLECTIECNPGDLSVETIERWKDAGINRVALGVQTLDPQAHRVIGRSTALCTPAHLERFFSVHGIVHAVDLIIGIPGLGARELAAELRTITDFGPEHISVYLLSIEPGTQLHGRLHPDHNFEAVQIAQYEQTMDFLSARGYRQYEVSNFERNGHRSRHNMKYWTFAPYAGFGPRAHSFHDGRRYAEGNNVADYIANGPRLVEDVRGPLQGAAEFVMTGLRLLDGFTLADMEAHTGVMAPTEFFRTLETLTRGGLLEIGSDPGSMRIRCTRKGLLLLDTVVMELAGGFLI